MEVREISVSELKKKIESKQDFLLIDVRNPDEYEYCNIDGELIPMGEIPERYSEIPKDKEVIVHCHHGGRSKKVIAWLQDNFDYNNLYNLTGGIHSWSEEIDSNVAIY
jgi:sulfur-carrier protein adenylyltransferase/sulfurtransferase